MAFKERMKFDYKLLNEYNFIWTNYIIRKPYLYFGKDKIEGRITESSKFFYYLQFLIIGLLKLIFVIFLNI